MSQCACPVARVTIKDHLPILYNTLLNYRDLIGYFRSRDIKQKFPFLRSCNGTVQIVLSIVRSISLFSTTQTVTMACNPNALNSESMNVAPQCERWNFIQ